MSQNPFTDLVQAYYHRPVEFGLNILGRQPIKWQARLKNYVAGGERLIAVRSGHGVGKTAALADLAVWFAITRYPFKIVMTAPTAPQLFDALWPETRSNFAKLPPAIGELFEVKAERIVLKGAPDDCFISARTSTKERPEAMAGVHSAHVLLIGDEAPAIPEEVFESAQGSMSGENACTILTGNPTRLTGLFYRAHHELRDDWRTMQVNCEDELIAMGGLVTPKYIQQVENVYGRESTQYRVRVLGEFPLVEDDVLMPRKLVRAAMERDMVVPVGVSKIWTVDPARYGNDRTAWAERVGSVYTWIDSKRGISTMEIVGWVKAKWDDLGVKDRPDEILVDVIGLGAGVVDRLEELKLPVRAINVSDAPIDFMSRGYQLRDDLWLKCQEWLYEGRGKLPDDVALEEDLVTPTYRFMSNGKLKVESKDDMRRRVKRSPDLADAIVLGFASDAATMLGAKRFRGKPIRRKLRGYG